jgi:DNA-binding transcriptional MerR regulator/methylmalonyl-CoA mutase cobalamin-binding subunit
MNEKRQFSMKYVSRKAGLTPHTIRAWEIRYRAVVPERTAKNRRLYSEEDIEKLVLLKRLKAAGHSIGQIAGLSLGDLRELIREENDGMPEPQESAAIIHSTDTAEMVNEALRHLSTFDGEALEKHMHKALAQLGRKALIEKFLVPLLERQGAMWGEGTLRIAHEHFGSSIIRGFLSNLSREPASPRPGHTMLVATPAGQNHEFGALFVAIEAASYGWRPLYIGPNLPAEEIAAAAIANRVRAVALSIVYPDDDPRLNEELVILRNCLPGETLIVAGGRAASGYREALENIGAFLIDDMSALDRFLLHPPGALQPVAKADVKI